MNNATLEHLLQIATPSRDAGPSATRPRGDAPPFDSLFRQANEPQARTDRSNDSSQPDSSSSPTSRPSNPPAASQDKSTASENSASNSNSEFVAESAAAGDEHEEAERDELETADVVAVAAIAVQESAPATEPAAELAVVAEVEQSIDAAEPNGDTKPKADAKSTPVAESLPEVPATTATAEKEPSEEELVADEAAPVEAKSTGGEQAETTPEVQLTAQIEASTAFTPEAKGKVRATSKTREGDTTNDSNKVSESVTEQATVHTEATAVGKEKETEAAPALETAAESARQDAEAKPSAARPESANSDQTAASSANRDQAPAPFRPAATVAARIAANIQQHSQAANTTANTNAANTIDATTKTDVARAKDAALSPFDRLERNQTGTSRGASGAGHSQSSHHVDPARFVSRVARAIHTAQERGAPLQLRLSPPELGAMRIELSVNQGNLTATIETDNSSARQVLLENLPALRERLAEQNVKIERFDVDVRRDPTGQQNPAMQQQNDQPQQDRAATRGQSLRNSTNQTTADEPLPVRRTITASSINVIA